MGQQEMTILIVVFGIVFIILLFTIFRAITTWYFKIDDIVNNQEKQIELMQKLVDTFVKEEKKE
jgi:hypothetical protein